MNILFKNATIISKDKIVDGFLCVKDKYVYAVCDTCPLDFVPDRTIDAKGKVIMPGLYNAHTHSPMTFLRNFADGLPLSEWLFSHIFPAEDKMIRPHYYYGALLGIMEMLSTGTVCFADMYMQTETIAQAACESGIKANISRGCTGNGDAESLEKIKENEDLFYKYNNKDKILVDFSAHAVYTCTPGYIEKIVNAAKNCGAGLHIHLSETVKENEDCKNEYGMSPTKLFETTGAFDVRTIAAHCVHLSDEDIDILKNNNVFVSHNPTSNLKLGSGIADVVKLKNNGITVALGTDGASSNNNLNMFEEMHIGALCQCGVNMDAAVITPTDALLMATRNGALAMGREDCGVLEKNSRADLIMIDTDKPHLTPLNNPVNAAVYSMQGSDVCLTMVDGEILYENGKFNTIDTELVYYNIRKYKEQLFV